MNGGIVGVIRVLSLAGALYLPLSAAFLASRSPRVRVGFLSNENQARDTNAFEQEEVGVSTARLVQPSMALVIPRGVRNMTTRGSAFILDGSEIDEIITGVDGGGRDCLYLLTAAHVAAPGMDIDLRFAQCEIYDDEAVRGRVLGRNRTLDLALLTIPVTSTCNDTAPGDATQCRGLKLATRLPHTGTRTFAHGFPASRLRGPAMTSGIVCGIADGLGLPRDQADETANNETDDTSYIVTDAAMSPGMSGGALTDRYGRVLGINALIRPDLRALGNYAVSAEEIRRFLKRDCAKSLTKSQPNEGNENSTAARDIRYRVLLFNDPMNKRGRVSRILRQVAKLSEENAHKVMMEALRTGTGAVKEFEEKEQAETLCQALKQEDLLIEVDTTLTSGVE